MSYLVLSRKYRPQNFREVVGQPHIVTTLVHALQTNRVAHAYLFAGPRGVGKTSMARILSKALNCEDGPTEEPCLKCSICKSITDGNDMDVLEIDGASNRGIEEVRSIRQNVRYRPASGRHKIYIIDEVHMLTKEAFNAILKTLEEPPEHVKFLFATTSPSRVPDTVQSRCQRFDFKAISVADISNRLLQICSTEKILTDNGVLQTIARYSRGGLRDSESLLDQLASFCDGKITLGNVQDVLGIVDEEKLINVMDSFIGRSPETAVEVLHQISDSGKNVEGFVDQLLFYIRDLLLVSISSSNHALVDTTARNMDLLKKQASTLSPDSLMYMIQLLSEANNKAKDLLHQKILLEVAFVKLATMDDLKPLDTVLDRIQDMKALLDTGGNDMASGASISGETISVPKKDIVKNIVPLSKSSSQESSVNPGNKVDHTSIRNQDIPGGGLSEEGLSGDVNLDSTWNKVLSELQQRKKTLWALLRSSRLLSISSNEATVGLPANYLIHKKRLEKSEEKQLIEKSLEKVVGNIVQVRLTISQNGRRMETTEDDSVMTRVHNGSKEAIMKEPIVKKTTDILNGSIVNIRRRKE
ncbi:MAG: DNA polymerase III subunit gamma/tau [Planctomycetes bacterium]|nr:DNA polymerase III subunit gamma/tau [Planctomycetota bacterium]